MSELILSGEDVCDKASELNLFQMPSLSESAIQNQQSEAVPVVYRYFTSLRSQSSVTTTRNRLLKIASILWPRVEGDDALKHAPWHKIKRDQVDYLIAALLSGGSEYKNSYINNIIATLSGLMNFCADKGLIEKSSLSEIFKNSRLAEDLGSRRGVSLNSSEIDAFFDATKHIKQPLLRARDRVLLSMLYGCGMRSFEVSRARLKHLDMDAWLLSVRGKGNKQATIEVPKRFRRYFKAWIEKYRCSDHKDELIICRMHSRGTVLRKNIEGILLTQPVTTKAMIERLRFIASNSKLPQRIVESIATHDMRRSVTGNLLENNTDIRMVQQHLRHQSVQTTEGYDRRKFDAKRAGLDSI